MFLFLTLLLIPVTTFAICKISMDVNSTVEIEKVDYFSMDMSCYFSSPSSLRNKLPLRLAYPKNATWEEYFESSFFEALDDDVKEFLQATIQDGYSTVEYVTNEGAECYQNAEEPEEWSACIEQNRGMYHVCYRNDGHVDGENRYQSGLILKDNVSSFLN